MIAEMVSPDTWLPMLKHLFCLALLPAWRISLQLLSAHAPMSLVAYLFPFFDSDHHNAPSKEKKSLLPISVLHPQPLQDLCHSLPALFRRFQRHHRISVLLRSSTCATRIGVTAPGATIAAITLKLDKGPFEVETLDPILCFAKFLFLAGPCPAIVDAIRAVDGLSACGSGRMRGGLGGLGGILMAVALTVGKLLLQEFDEGSTAGRNVGNVLDCVMASVEEGKVFVVIRVASGCVLAFECRTRNEWSSGERGRDSR